MSKSNWLDFLKVAITDTNMDSKSPSFSLNSVDWSKIGTGALVALAGAVLTYIPLFAGYSYVIPFNGHSFDATPLVMVGLSVLSNVLRKFITNHQAA